VKYFLQAIPITLMLAGVSAHAADPPATPQAGIEQSLREAMLLPPDTKLIYLDEKGAPLTAEVFLQRSQAGAQVDVARNAAARTATLRLKASQTPQSEIGSVTTLPPFDLRDLYNRRLRNLDLAGRPTLINFFFETCVPCIKEAPVLNSYRRRHQEFNYLAITPDSAEEAKRFVAQRNFDWPVAYEGDSFIAAMKVTGYPTYLLVASDGRILGRGAGMDVRDMEDPLRALAEFERWVSERLSQRD
jgi:thiol-disulfide isomerase/thioredoxin